MALIIKKKPASVVQSPGVSSPPPSSVGGSLTAPKINQGASTTPQPSIAVVSKTGVASVTKEFKDGTVVDETTNLSSVQSTSPLATVYVSMSLTRNLGNFESVKVNVGVTLPCVATPDEIETTYEEAKGWVDAKILGITQEVDKALS